MIVQAYYAGVHASRPLLGEAYGVRRLSLLSTGSRAVMGRQGYLGHIAPALHCIRAVYVSCDGDKTGSCGGERACAVLCVDTHPGRSADVQACSQVTSE